MDQPGVFYEAPPPQMPARLVTLSQGPLTVRWTGEPVWAGVHFIRGLGQRGRSLPHEREQCPVCRVHATVIEWHAFVPAIRPKARAAPRRAPDTDERDADRLRRFNQLPEEARALLMTEAWERNPQLHRHGANGLFHRRAAAALMPAAALPASVEILEPRGPAALEAVIVDLPDGCAYDMIERYDRGCWRGRKCRLSRRPGRGNKTVIDEIDEPAVLLPEPVSAEATLCRLWGYAIGETSQAVEDERTVLAFRRQFA